MIFFRKNLLRPSDTIQKEILCGAIVELLWKVRFASLGFMFTSDNKCGETKQAVLAIPGTEPGFESTAFLTFDGLTEKVRYGFSHWPYRYEFQLFHL